MNPVTGLARLPGRILWCVHMGNFSPVDQLYHFGRYLVKAKLFCRKCFVPVTELEWENFHPGFNTEISVAKTEISVTGPAGPLI